MAAIRLDDGVGGMRRDFERTVAFLLPTDPVMKRQKDNKRGAAYISAVDNPGTDESVDISGTGESGGTREPDNNDRSDEDCGKGKYMTEA